MNNILIIGFYGFKDGYLAYGKYLRKKFDHVGFFPLVELRDRLMEKNEKFNVDDIKRTIEGKLENKNLYSDNLIIKDVKYNNIILSHNNDFLKIFKLGDTNFFDKIVNWKEEINFKLFQINWDADPKNINFEKSKYFNKRFCSNPLYLINSNTEYFKTGFCKETSFYKELEEYKCDVSFVGTNLYEKGWENRDLNRQKILDKIYSDDRISLHVYGPEFLKMIYPRSYKGFIPYDECYKVFSNSKINLNISPINNVEYQGKYYYSERMPQIFACDGIMMSNNDYGDMLQKNKDYLYLDDIDKLIDMILEYKEGIKRFQMLQKVKSKKVIFDYETIIDNLNL